MSQASLEQRVSALEQRVDALLADRPDMPRRKDSHKTRGAFTGDSVMKRVFAEGRKARLAEPLQ